MARVRRLLSVALVCLPAPAYGGEKAEVIQYVAEPYQPTDAALQPIGATVWHEARITEGAAPVAANPRFQHVRTIVPPM